MRVLTGEFKVTFKGGGVVSRLKIRQTVTRCRFRNTDRPLTKCRPGFGFHALQVVGRAVKRGCEKSRFLG